MSFALTLARYLFFVTLKRFYLSKDIPFTFGICPDMSTSVRQLEAPTR